MLNEVTIKKAKPKEKPYKLYDGKSLYLLVNKNGSKYWRYDYKYSGRRKTLSLGMYPEVSLKEAREKRDEFRKMLHNGLDPSYYKKTLKKNLNRSENLKYYAYEWFEKNKHQWKESHARTVMYRINRYIIPHFGEKPINIIEPIDILDMLKSIESEHKVDTAKRVKQILSGIFRYAIVLRAVSRDPTQDITGLLASARAKHYPTILDPMEIGKLLYDISNYEGILVRYALKLLILTFVRPGELRNAKWNEFNFSEMVWDIPAERMKLKKEHRVYLSSQAMEILEKLKIINGKREYVFCGRDINKPISDGTLNRALRIMGYDTKNQITAHGFRAMARTLIHEKLKYPPEVIEHQLAHRVPDILGEAYNRTKFADERKKMMQDWADYLDSLKNEYIKTKEE